MIDFLFWLVVVMMSPLVIYALTKTITVAILMAKKQFEERQGR